MGGFIIIRLNRILLCWGFGVEVEGKWIWGGGRVGVGVWRWLCRIRGNGIGRVSCLSIFRCFGCI